MTRPVTLNNPHMHLWMQPWSKIANGWLVPDFTFQQYAEVAALSHGRGRQGSNLFVTLGSRGMLLWNARVLPTLGR